MTIEEDPRRAAVAPSFDAAFRTTLVELLTWRRDVRGFRPDALPPGALDRLLDLASLAPSVGLSQPTRFVAVEEPSRRQRIRDDFERCNAEALRRQPSERAARYASLKLAGLDRAPCHLAVFADPRTPQGHGLGRLTMPETIAYSAVLAIHTLWLAARAEGIGLGWVSILDPGHVAAILDVPEPWTFIGYLCLGLPEVDADTPELEREAWERRRPAPVVLRR